MELSNLHATGLPHPLTPLVVVNKIISHEEMVRMINKGEHPITCEPLDTE